MKINRKLNLVMEVDLDNGTIAHVHSTPISMECFNQNYDVLSVTFTKLFQAGLIFASRIADTYLKDTAKTMNRWDGPTGVHQSLINEVHRLTNVLIPGKSGWEMIPYDDARKTLFSEEDCADIEAALCFFTVAFSRLTVKDEWKAMEVMLGSLGGRTISSGCTDYLSSLQTASAIGSSGKTDTPQVESVQPSSPTLLNGQLRQDGRKSSAAISISRGTPQPSSSTV